MMLQMQLKTYLQIEIKRINWKLINDSKGEVVFMKKAKYYMNSLMLKMRMRLKKNEGFGMNELLGIAAALILAAFVIIPGLNELAKSVIDGLKGWWTKIAAMTFSTSG
jgi:hypothetical protein